MVPLIEDIRLTIKKPDQRSAPRDDKRAWPQSLALVAVQSLPKLMMSAWKLWAVHHSKPKEQPQRSTIKKLWNPDFGRDSYRRWTSFLPPSPSFLS